MDMIDVAQRRQMEAIEQALASRKTAGQGRTHCIAEDCGAPIAPVRQAMGAQLCLDCQRAAEQRAQSWARTAI